MSTGPNFPQINVDQYSDYGERDDESYFLSLSFQNDVTFDFGFGREIGYLLDCSFNKIARKHGAYTTKSGSGWYDYFFINLSDAESCQKELTDIVTKIRQDEKSFSGMVKRFKKMILQSIEKSKNNGWLNDAQYMIDNFDYLVSTIE